MRKSFAATFVFCFVRSGFLALVCCAVAGLPLFGQTSSYYVHVWDGELGGAFQTGVTFDNGGGGAAAATIEFFDDISTPMPIASLDGLLPNCGVGCFSIQVPGGESFSGQTPGIGPNLAVGYAKVTADADISTTIELTSGLGCVSEVPGATTPDTASSFSFTDESETVVVLLNPGGVVATLTLSLFDDSQPPNLIEVRQEQLAAEARSTRLLNEIFPNPPTAGRLRVESDEPVFVAGGEIDFVTICVTFIPGTPPCTLDLTLTMAGGTLETGFDLGTLKSARWDVWLVSTFGIDQLWSADLTVIDPPVSFPVGFPFPSIGHIAIVTTLINAQDELVCIDGAVVDTGGVGATPEELSELLGQSGILQNGVQ